MPYFPLDLLAANLSSTSAITPNYSYFSICEWVFTPQKNLRASARLILDLPDLCLNLLFKALFILFTEFDLPITLSRLVPFMFRVAKMEVSVHL